MNKNEKILISPNSPIHANRIGYFQFCSTDCADDIIILSSIPEPEPGNLSIHSADIYYFGVNKEFIKSF